MAKVFNNNIIQQKAGRTQVDQEASKVEEGVASPVVQVKDQECKNSDESSPEESNVVRVTAGVLHSDGEIDQNNSHLMDVDEKHSQNSYQRGNENNSENSDLYQREVNANFLRRSERNVKNSQSSYGVNGRRPFKYDDFEYGPNIGQKTGLEMNPPVSVTNVKRKRKASATIPPPFEEGTIKRSQSTKLPSNHTPLASPENNGVAYNQGRWT